MTSTFSAVKAADAKQRQELIIMQVCGMSILYIPSKPGLQLLKKLERTRKMELLFPSLSWLIFWPWPDEEKAAREALDSWCPSNKKRISIPGFKAQLPFLIQVAHDIRLSIISVLICCITSSSCPEYINLVLPHFWLLGFAAHTLEFKYCFNKEYPFFLEKKKINKRKLFSP